MNEQACTRVIISGVVQKVGFRWRARQAALTLGLSGWIKNRPDGSVEAVIQGSRVSVDEMIRWVHIGPAGAEVRDVRLHACDYDGTLLDFAILREN
ncbi:MAG: acylphosphatase [Thermovirgaceae bacterium]|nr:acylphosphatase [Thermovirgaceae bacterium]